MQLPHLGEIKSLKQYWMPPGWGAVSLKKRLAFAKSLGKQWGKTNSSIHVPKILTVYHKTDRTLDEGAQKCCRNPIPRVIRNPMGQHGEQHSRWTCFQPVAGVRTSGVRAPWFNTPQTATNRLRFSPPVLSFPEASREQWKARNEDLPTRPAAFLQSCRYMPGPPSAGVLNAQPREAGKGPGQPPAKKGHWGMLNAEQRTGIRLATLSGTWPRDAESGGVSYSQGVGRRGLPSWLHPRVPAHQPDPQNCGGVPDIAAVSAGRCLLLQASGAARFVLPNCPLWSRDINTCLATTEI